MFEAHVLHLLRRYLGEYVHGLSVEALRISVWKGDVVLRDLKLKAEALNSLELPVTVKAGSVGTITLKVPWKSLGKEPVIVLIDRVFVLVHPAADCRTLKDEDKEKLFEAKRQQIEEAESATLEALSRSKLGSPPANSWLGSLISTIIGNLKITISNLHIRYEDSVSNPENPFSSGVTLAKLAAVTMDEQGNETFDTSGALDKLRKSLQLQRLAVYHDCNSVPWKIGKRWEDLSPKEWIEIFEDGINEPASDHRMLSRWAIDRNYLVSPINGVLKYHRLGNQERTDPEIPFEKASLALSDVSLTITEAQYYDWIKLLEVVSKYKTNVGVSHLRPVVLVSAGPYLWWRYAVQAALQQKKIRYCFSWDQIRHLCQLRRRYIQLYAGSLQQFTNINSSEIREIEKDLDSKVILLWRLLAHAKVESVKSKEAAEQSKHKKGGWFTFGWRTYSNGASSVRDASEESQLKVGRLTKEEWQAINNLLSYQPDEELISHSGRSMQNMIRLSVTVSIAQAAARIININQTEIVCGRFEQLHVSTKFKHRTTYCDVLLKFYGLSAPEGTLAQSVSTELNVNALAASFVNLPVGENIDWRLSATISPCHATVLMKSYDRFLDFVKRSNAISPAVAMETATALQTKIEEVTCRAQEQIQMVLEEQSRFALDIDFAAPKVRVPIRRHDSSICNSHFILDFGHFTLHTMEILSDEQEQNLYSRFYISGRDIAAFFTDCGSGSQNCVLVGTNCNSQPNITLPEKDDGFLSLIDRCGMALIVDRIKVPHPSYPSTRISVQVPNLGIHFSPARHCKFMEFFYLLYGAMESSGQPIVENFQTQLSRSSPIDLAIDARILVWRGIGNSVASLQPCFLVLSGVCLYVLESENSQSYQQYLSMAVRQVFDVPPAYIGGSPFCVAVTFRGLDIQKALESSSICLIEFRDAEEKATWSKGLVQATYQASAHSSVDILDGTSDSVAEMCPQATNLKTAELVINGTLVETKLFMYGKIGDKVDEQLEETLILEVLAGGGKVHIVFWEGDLTVKMKLHSLKIKDELQGCLSKDPQYLACSVLSNENRFPYSGTSDRYGKQTSVGNLEDDEIFKDALPDFLSLSEPGIYSQNMDMAQSGSIGVISDSTESKYTDALVNERDLRIRKSYSGEIFYETQGGEHTDFVCVTFHTRSSGSPDYVGIDRQVSIRMSTLEFFCNRPTLVALIGFGFDLCSVNPDMSSTDIADKSLMNKEKTEENGRVTGLLGYGKSRVMFYLNMNIDSVAVFLNKEDGSQHAMLVQENFLLDLKVHPSSLSIEGTLGNFRLCDMLLGIDHCWGWLCDIRNPGVESLVKFKFNSYSAEDDDYEGYDYSLSGRLSAVRIVFLYRFVQEITVYFMELATPRTEEAFKLVNMVGDFEWLIQKYEIDGATALKLDLSLDTPIIIVPRDSMSKDFIQLDLGQLQVTNEFSWHGCPEKDPSAVHIDVLHAKLLGINMSVGINGCIGKPMIREGRGVDVYVRRSLRDVFRKVPTFSLEVKVDVLHAVMSDKEYNVILDCSCMNLCEEPKLPPSFRGTSNSKDTMQFLADKVNMNSQILLSRTVNIMAVEVNYALLELCNGTHERILLAHIALEGLWVSYRSTSSTETDLYITIPKFSIVDIRTDTKPEMRLMLGSSTDVSKYASTGSIPFFLDKGSFMKPNSEAGLDAGVSNSTMFLMDYRRRVTSQSYVIQVQQPRVLVVPDFLLAVGEFFVPSLKAITGREETMDPKNDPLSRRTCIMLCESVYKQTEDVVHLSPNRQLVADTIGIDEYTYDGCGKIICLTEVQDSKELHSASSGPIIIIGRGKRLRFVNVKIENGFLLRKYAYLNNGSSYSVTMEDGVDILLIYNSSSDDDKKQLECMHETSGTSNASLDSQSDANTMRSFTFEVQVVSPEFTFYDCTKSSLNDSSYGEKLLRAKLDLSFMYAAKENDTWIRALVKDLMIEGGSGLIILDPVEISGGYTSVKDKVNISLISTDIHIHLSLPAISLVLSLQSQAAAALELGNATPLAPCTNFDRLWVPTKEIGCHKNLTFWRPRAPSNYVILGDCVTSRTIPPSQVVMAVSNTYGRVQKPINFNLIFSFSGTQGLEGGGILTDDDDDCSLWMPIAPPGYRALGCVAHIGRRPPPNHIVYCVRSDLVTSTMYSECIFSAQSNPSFASRYSIWRLDNVTGSFYAHALAECPPKDASFDLNYLLVWNSTRHHFSYPQSTSDLNVVQGYGSQQSSTHSENTSGWDVFRSVSRETNCVMSTPNFERIWWDKGGDLHQPVSIWRPITCPGYAVLGDCINESLEPPALGIIFKADDPEISAKPVQFTKVARIMVKGSDDVFFWYPIAPPGYASLGCVVSKKDEAPHINLFCCPRMDLVHQANILEMPVSRSSSSKSSQCWCIWRVENQACTFLARPDLKKPSSRLAYTLGDSVKRKARENITADMKLKCFSLTVLDSLCGTMAPLFDMTIANIKLATHGRLEAMNAVLILCIAASTFNTQLEAWEPLVESFDGIFKFETYDTNLHTPSRHGKRVHIAATSILNMNISAANLETLIETIVSWRRQLELEQKATRLDEEAKSHFKQGEDQTISALDEDDFQTVIIENKLGCVLYLKKVEPNSDTVDLLHHDDSTPVWIPPPRFSDRLNFVNEYREARYYVSIQILEAKDLPIIDDGNSQNIFCALRLAVNSPATDHQKLFPQSARTKCVKPVFSKINDLDQGTVRWNEFFILEVPCKGLAKLEVEVTNLGAKAGKGEVIGATSFAVGHGASTLKKIASARMLHEPHDAHNVVSYTLRRNQHSKVENAFDCGFLLVSTSNFERKAIADVQRDTAVEKSVDRDIGFFVGLGPEGAWQSIWSLLPLSVVPNLLQDNYIAMEVVMKNGKKHAIFRGLATVVNDSDVKLDISLCPLSLNHGSYPCSGTSNCSIVVEEVFQNQQYQPSSGWGNKSSGLQSDDPGHWSTENFSYSSNDFFEPPLPTGWKWLSTWTIDKPQFVDNDGWVYGPDFQSLKWPPNSSKSHLKSAPCVRRRRWICARKECAEEGNNSMTSDFTPIAPGSLAVLPWDCTSKDSDQYLQVRPSADHTQPPYLWGQAVAVDSGYTFGKDHPSIYTGKHGNIISNVTIKLNDLGKKDMLFCCYSGHGDKQFWLSISADASILHTELNTPVYDWRISMNAPLKFENRLPCPAELSVWEKSREGNSIVRHHCLISSRKSVHVYSADVQTPLYISLLVEGGWVLEKDPILVLDQYSTDHVSSLWMIHQQSKRRLRVSIERDMGGTHFAPKIIKFFVPYWILNNSSMDLAYHIVEIEPSENGDLDSRLLSRAVKSAKTTLKSPTNSMELKYLGTRRNIQVLEVIEDTSPMPSMLSPQDYAGRSGSMHFSSQKDAYLSPRVGISIAIGHSEIYSPGISLTELEKKQRVDVKAFSSNGSYCKLSALQNMTSDRTKVVHFQPHTLFVNRVGCSVCLHQCDSLSAEWIHPTDPPKPFGWQSSAKVELLELRIDGYEWSTPFSVCSEGVMRISMKKDSGSDYLQLRVKVRSGKKRSRYEVIFCPSSSSSPYRIENQSMFFSIHFRQVDGVGDSWQFLLPNAAASFFWEDLGRKRLLELLVDGTDPLKSEKYSIDDIFDYQPIHVVGGPTRALRVTISKEDKMNVVKISDWMPENEPSTITSRRFPAASSQLFRNDPQHQQSPSTDCEFHVIVELPELGLSIIDNTPEEILYFSMQDLLLAYSTGLGSGISRFKFRMRGIQVDNQLPLTPMPVLFRPQRVEEQTDHILKLSITMQSNRSLDLCIYPYIGFQGPENSAFLINIHEPIIWRLHEMIMQVNFHRIYDAQTTSVSVDPIIQIGVLNISELRFKMSMTMSPSQRPRGELGFWLSLMTALGNTENMPAKINQKFYENICKRQSSMISYAITNIQKDFLSQPLQLLSGLDILGNASSALGHMSKGVAALSMDKKFIQSRQRKGNKSVEDFGDVIREGGGALAKGLFRGVTGILTKPLEGAKTSGVEGFVQGVGKGIIGAAAQPVSGVLDLLSKTTEGANAVRMKIASAITSDEQLLRRRLPRVISGDSLLRPYDEYRAQGQVMLQLAESGSFFGHVDLFKVRGKFALSDSYEDHFLLPKSKILIITHWRVILLQQPSNIIGQRKFNPARDPCSVLWDVLWDNLMTMELISRKKDQPKAPPSWLKLQLETRSTELKENFRVIKCSPQSNQAGDIYSSIEQAMNTYGLKTSKEMQKKKVTKPYSPHADGASVESFSKEGTGICSPQPVPASIPVRSTFSSWAN